MKKTIFLIGLLILLSAAAFFFNYTAHRPRACFRENCFSVELALTPEKHSQGLSFRQALADDRGMLFVFDKEGNYPFWMKNTLIPLDIIWLDREGKVVYTAQNAEPCQEEVCLPIIPTKQAKYVLEINAGLIQEMDLSLGDKIELTF